MNQTRLDGVSDTPSYGLGDAAVRGLVGEFRTTGLEKVVNPIFSRYEPLLLKWARFYFDLLSKYSKTERTCELDDFINCGRYGLFKAIQKFDLNSPNLFFTYAQIWIRSSCQRLFFQNRYGVDVSIGITEHVAKLRRIIPNLDYNLDRDPNNLRVQLSRSGSAINDDTWTIVKQLVRDGIRVFSLEDIVLGSDGVTYGERGMGDAGLDLRDEVEVRSLRELVRCRIDEIVPRGKDCEGATKEQRRLARDRMFFEKYFVEGLTHEEIAQIYQVTKQRVGQIIRRFKAKLVEDPALRLLWGDS